MDPARYQRLMDLFDEACDQPLAEQRALVARLMEEDPELGDKLSGLLEHDAKEAPMLEAGEGARALAQSIEADSGVEEAAATSRQGGMVGAWIIEERIGKGGVGAVHRAHHAETGQPAAIKFLSRAAMGRPEDLQRFDREFRAVASLDHPGCLRVYEQGEGPAGHYIVMEYAAGGDLRRLQGAPPRVVAPLLAQVADALVYVHSQGIVHRDVKPANLLLDGGEPPRVMLGDFGIAKMTDATAILTGTGAVMGSIDFMSPEQINGRPADVQSDVYAFGCTLFTMLAARAPFEGDNFERLYARLRHEAPPLASLLRDVPPALDVLCQRLMQRDPAARPRSLEGVADILRAV